MTPPTPFVYRALVTSVFDGDTVTASLDLGMSLSLKVSCRLEGLDTPEIHSKVEGEGKAAVTARDRLRELVLGRWVTLQSLAKPDKYGRLVVNIWVDDVLVNDILKQEGLAVEYHGGKRLPWAPTEG